MEIYNKLAMICVGLSHINFESRTRFRNHDQLRCLWHVCLHKLCSTPRSGSMRRVVLVEASITRVLQYRKSDCYYYCHYEVIGFSITRLLQSVKISHLTLTPA